VITGARNETDWEAAATGVDFFDVKGAIEAIIENLGKNRAEFSPSETIGYLHPGRAAVVSLGGNEVGFLGQLHPRVASVYKFKQEVYLAELDFGALSGSEAVEVRYRPLPKFPAVVRDLSLLVSNQVAYADVEGTIYGLEIPELVGVRLFDLYSGEELPGGKRSIALSLRFRADDRTLTDVEINAAQSLIVTALAEAVAAEVR